MAVAVHQRIVRTTREVSRVIVQSDIPETVSTALVKFVKIRFELVQLRTASFDFADSTDIRIEIRTQRLFQ